MAESPRYEVTEGHRWSVKSFFFRDAAETVVTGRECAVGVGGLEANVPSAE